MATARIGPQGLNLIQHWERCRLRPYLDDKGIPTIGWGAIRSFDGTRVTMAHRPITQAEADWLLARDSLLACNAINALITAQLAQSQVDALGAFTFNLGYAHLSVSTLRRVINAGEWARVKTEWLKWDKEIRPGGIVVEVNGLKNRRESELALWMAA
jgi:lysozyme